MARGLPDLDGYTRIAGDSARRVRTPDGDTISRREYENRRFAAGGWESWRDYQNRRNDDAYQRLVRSAATQHGVKVDELRRVDSEFNRLYLQSRRARFDNTARGRDPNGPFAKLLKYSGLRTDRDTHQIGDTPGKGRGRR